MFLTGWRMEILDRKILDRKKTSVGIIQIKIVIYDFIDTF